MADQTPTPETPPAEFVRGPAGPDQQPYGQATQQNEAVAQIPPPEAPAPVEPAAPETPQTPVAPAPGPGFPQEFQPQTDEEKHLFGPTNDPATPVNGGRAPDPVPPNLVAWLPVLTIAAASPNATWDIRNLAARGQEMVHLGRLNG